MKKQIIPKAKDNHSPTEQDVTSENVESRSIKTEAVKLGELQPAGVVSRIRKPAPEDISSNQITEKIEELADLEHQQWAHWTKYLLSNFNKENVERWSALIKIPYNMLSEKEKESDREWARKVLEIIKQPELSDKEIEKYVKALKWRQKRCEELHKEIENLKKQQPKLSNEEIIEEVLKKGQCPDCSEKGDKCKCKFKELFITIKRNDLKKAIQMARGRGK